EPGDAPVALLRPELVEALVVNVRPGVRLPAELGSRRIPPDLDLHRLDRLLAWLAHRHGYELNSRGGVAPHAPSGIGRQFRPVWWGCPRPRAAYAATPMQPGVVGMRGAITALWEADLRAVREDRYDTEPGKEALAFIQRFNSMIAQLRVPIQQSWGAGGLVHVADNPEVAGPGQRVSQTRVKLRNHGEAVVVEAFAYVGGESKPDPGLGLDREFKVAGI